jgi:hypothetical protein
MPPLELKQHGIAVTKPAELKKGIAYAKPTDLTHAIAKAALHSRN